MAMFGATVLVPILTGLDPGVGLMTSGIGTILYLICTRSKIPSYLGSSFAFIAPLIAVGGGSAAIAAGKGNLPAALGGLVAAGIVYMIVAGFVKIFGTGWITKLLPPALVMASRFRCIWWTSRESPRPDGSDYPISRCRRSTSMRF
jgi:uracil permease